MNHQAPLALPPPAGTAHWGEDVLFSERVTGALSDINGQFLALAVELHAARPGMPAFGLSAHLLALLARCGQRVGTLRLPYAVYDLRFTDDRFWRQCAAAAIAVHDAQVGASGEVRVLRFARIAVTFAWHLSQSDPRVARLALGMTRPTLDVLARLPIGALDALARRVAPVVGARFCTRERFWQLLCAALRFSPDEQALARLKLLGLQLQGTESARVQQVHRRLRRSAQP